LSHTELQFFMRPVCADTAPGVPMPTVAASPISASASRTSVTMVSSVAFVIVAWCRHAPAQALPPLIIQNDDLGLGAPQVDADAVHALGQTAIADSAGGV
jgi:hypothetical protein